MKTVFFRVFLNLSLLALTACSAVKPIIADKEVVYKSTVLTASAYGELRQQPQLSATENRYASEQTATLKAYRQLAQQLYQQQLENGVSIADRVIADEAFRVYTDLYLREAKASKGYAAGGQIKVALQLTLTPRFYQCLSGTANAVRQCLQEDNKIPFTRIGYQKATASTVNLSCGGSDCSSQLSIAGFSNQKNSLDRAMLNYGLYDSEWVGSIGVEAMLRYLYLTQFVFN